MHVSQFVEAISTTYPAIDSCHQLNADSAHVTDILRRTVLTFLIAAAGGTVGHLLNLPAGALSGAAIASAAAALMGAKLGLENRIRSVGFLIVGVSLGSGVTEQTLKLLPNWPVSLAVLIFCVAAIMVVVPYYLRRVHSYDAVTAQLAAVPGALSYVLAVAAETKADVRRVAILQSVRVVVLVALFPLLVEMFIGTTNPSSMPSETTSLPQLGLTFVVGGLLTLGFGFLNVPAASFTAALMASAMLHGFDVVQGRPPLWLLLPAFFLMGGAIGARFSGLDRATLRQSLVAGLVSLLIGTFISCVFAWPVAAVLGLSFTQVWLAYAPGGIEAVTVLAFAMGFDPAFVAGHQLLRFIGLSIAVPVLMRKLASRQSGGYSGSKDEDRSGGS